jgi:hypothetical protein
LSNISVILLCMSRLKILNDSIKLLLIPRA